MRDAGCGIPGLSCDVQLFARIHKTFLATLRGNEVAAPNVFEFRRYLRQCLPLGASDHRPNRGPPSRVPPTSRNPHPASRIPQPASRNFPAPRYLASRCIA